MGAVVQTPAVMVDRAIISREIVLLLCVASLLVLFSFTALVSRMYHKKVHRLADDWFAAGEAEFAGG